MSKPHHPACALFVLLACIPPALATQDADVRLSVLSFANWVQAQHVNVQQGCRVRTVCNVRRDASTRIHTHTPQSYCLYWSLCPTPQGDATRVTSMIALPNGPGALQHVPLVPTAQPPKTPVLWESTPRGRDPWTGAPSGWTAATNDSTPPAPRTDDGPVLDSALAVAVASLSDLRALHVSGVGLQGVLPAIWGASLPMLTYVNLSHNVLSGTLPPSFGRLASLAVLYACPR